MQLKLAASIDPERATDALVRRLCGLLRDRARTGVCSDLPATVSALSMLVFGDNRTAENYLRDAAFQTADLIHPLLDDTGVMKVFAGMLMFRYRGVMVRDLFEPVEPVEATDVAAAAGSPR